MTVLVTTVMRQYSPVLVIFHVKIRKSRKITSTMENYEHPTKLHEFLE